MSTSTARDAHLFDVDSILVHNIAPRKRTASADAEAAPPRVKRKPTQRTSDTPWYEGNARTVDAFVLTLARATDCDPSWSEDSVRELHDKLGQPPLDPKSPSYTRRAEDDPVDKVAWEAAEQGVDLEEPARATKLLLRKLYVDHSMRPELINNLWRFPCLQRSDSFKAGFVAEHVRDRYGHSIWQQLQ